MRIAWTGAGVVRLRFAERSAAATEALLRSRTGAAHPSEPPPAIADVIARLKRYFAGEAVAFDDVPVALPKLDESNRRIYAAARALPWGRTATYGEIAKSAGAEAVVPSEKIKSGAQAVGVAMSRNPVPIIIPCHRVLAAGGKVGGFSAPGGAATKERLLKMEGVLLDGGQPSLGDF